MSDLIATATVPSDARQARLDEKRQGIPDGAMAGLVAGDTRLIRSLWSRGRVMFDIQGIAVVVGSDPKGRGVPIAIVSSNETLKYFHKRVNSKMPYFRQVEAIWEGLVDEHEVETTLMQFGEIAARLVELRLGGWQMKSDMRFSGPSEHTYSGMISDPLTSIEHYTFPDRLSKRGRKRRQQLRQVISNLQTLPDSPLLLARADILPQRLDQMHEYLAERETHLLERMVIARYPELDIGQAMDIAEQAGILITQGDDRLSAIEAAHQTAQQS